MLAHIPVNETGQDSRPDTLYVNLTLVSQVRSHPTKIPQLPQNSSTAWDWVQTREAGNEGDVTSKLYHRSHVFPAYFLRITEPRKLQCVLYSSDCCCNIRFEFKVIHILSLLETLAYVP